MGIGLVLEGGGMRGIYTAGVLDVFLERGIHFDNCLAVSAGACHACSFLSGQKGRALAVATDYLGDWRYCSLRSWLLTGNLFGSKFIYHRIPEELYPIDNEAFKRSGTVFQAAVTNCRTGEAEYPAVGDLLRDIDIVRASSSLPLAARRVSIGGEKYLDGGMGDPIPLLQSIRQGNEKNVVVLTQHRDYRKEPNRLMPLLRARYFRYPRLLEKLRDRHLLYNRTLERVAAEEEAGRAFVIAPSAPLEIGRIEKRKERLLAVYEQGRRDAEQRIPGLLRYLDSNPID